MLLTSAPYVLRFKNSSNGKVAFAGSGLRSLNRKIAPFIMHISASPPNRFHNSLLRVARNAGPSLALTVALIITQAHSAPLGLAADYPPSEIPGQAEAVPRLWNDAEWSAMTLPAARVRTRILYLTSEHYYKIPEQAAWKSYKVYAPDREPPGYKDRLKTLDPEIVFEASQPKTVSEWRTAGEILFDTPFDFSALDQSPVSDPQWWKTVDPPLSSDGSTPSYRYVIRKRGVLEAGSGACASCHSRVMNNGAVIKGAQGNFPLGAAEAYRIRNKFPLDQKLPEKDRRLAAAFVFPQIRKEELSYKIYEWPAGKIANAYEALIPGIAAREGFTM
jgi:hypothetical protein